MAEKIWQIFHGRNPNTRCYSSHKFMFLTNGAPFERELNRLSNGIRFIAKKHCYHREIIYQTQMSLLFLLSLDRVNPPRCLCCKDISDLVIPNGIFFKVFSE